MINANHTFTLTFLIAYYFYVVVKIIIYRHVKKFTFDNVRVKVCITFLNI
jgi:hypothetical protein